MASLSFIKLHKLISSYKEYVINKDRKTKFGNYSDADVKFRASVACGWASDFLIFAQTNLQNENGKKQEKKKSKILPAKK